MANLIYKGLKANLPETREANSIYFVTDAREIYFGADLYTEPTRFYTGDKPATPAQGVLYVNEETGAGDVWNGTAWKNVIKGYVTTIDTTASDDTVPTSKAAKDYIDQKVEDVVAGSIDGLGELAGKDEVTEAELGTDLAAKINGKAEQTALDAEVTRATAAEEALDGRVTTVEGKVDTLIGTDTGKSVRAIAEEEAADAINEFSTNITDDGVVNSYKELIDWVATHGGEAAEMAAAIEALEAIVAGIGGEGEQPTVVAYVAAAIEALKIGDYAKAEDLTALAARVTALETDNTTNKADIANLKSADTTLQENIDAEKTRAEAAEQANATAAAAAQAAADQAQEEVDAVEERVAVVEAAITVGTF